MLTPEETGSHIMQRPYLSGYRGIELFNTNAINTLHEYSNGLMRRINSLAEKSLLVAYAAQQKSNCCAY